MGIIKPATIQASVTYPFIEPWGPKAISIFGAIIPMFKDMFQELENFFNGVSTKI
jgi:membrane protein required for colicin V production